MKLTAWLQAKKLTGPAFARMISVTPQAVHRYERGERVPRKDVLTRIVLATGGAVTANDFHDCSLETEEAA